MRSLISAGLLATLAQAASAQQESLGITVGDSASNFSRETGRRLTFICPAITTPSENVWGTDVYSDDSAICTAAIHAGVLQFGQAGRVSIVMGAVNRSFTGSGRNAVKTQSYNNSDYSYTFSQSPDTATIDWSTTALRIPAEFTEPVTVICPGGHKSDASVWGADTYMVDSSICNAAVHAGAIAPPPQGGALTVTKVAGIDAYVAESRNGISSIAWSAAPDAFRVSAAQAFVSSPERFGRLIQLAGFRFAGRGADQRPRTIRLAGFTTTGTGPDQLPRRIRLNGWSATGPAP